jgi:hypothetical protein
MLYSSAKTFLSFAGNAQQKIYEAYKINSKKTFTTKKREENKP